MCTMHVSGPHGDKERVLNLLNLELQAVVSRPMRAGNRTRLVLWESIQCSSPESLTSSNLSESHLLF